MIKIKVMWEGLFHVCYIGDTIVRIALRSTFHFCLIRIIVINSKVDSSSKKQNNTEKKSVTKKANKIASKKSTISKKVANQKNALKTYKPKIYQTISELRKIYDLPAQAKRSPKDQNL